MAQEIKILKAKPPRGKYQDKLTIFVVNAIACAKINYDAWGDTLSPYRFKEIIESDLQTIPRMSVAIAEDSFKIEVVKNKVNIYHLSCRNEINYQLFEIEFINAKS